MDQRRRNTGIADVTFQAYDRQEGIEDDEPRSCGLSAKNMIAIAATCSTIALIAYMITTSLGVSEASHEQSSGKDQRQVRLPRDLLPTEYKLKIIPNMEEGNFTSTGELRITLECKESVRQIRLHAREISFRSIRVQDSFADKIPVTSLEQIDSSDLVIIGLNQTLKRGERYQLLVHFTSILTNVLQGFYKSSYMDASTNQVRWMASTQFSPTYARLAFPCFDEPSFKAKFKISLGRRKNMTSLSNMPLKFTEPIIGMPGFEWDHYQETLPMSTYLVAFIVTDFESVEVPNVSHPTFKLWSRRDALDQTKYVADIGPRILRFLEGYFNVTFPLEKQDLIALPEFGYTAMENWGLITFREFAMLIKENESVANARQYVSVVVGHEFSHQWFGNLVTPTWWSDLWLKEGFASFFGILAVDYVEPTWRVSDIFIEDLHKVFEDDALDSSHPISMTLNRTDEITQIFDAISYTKGCSIVRMMSHFLGADIFQLGIQRYLKKYAYLNAEQDDLWAALTEEAHLHHSLPEDMSVKTVMDTWTLQTGYPILQVQRDYNTGEVTVSQEQFTWASKHNESSGTWWMIPLTWMKKGHANYNTMPKAWLDQTSLKLNDTIPDNEWILFNIDQTVVAAGKRKLGYYRVNYDVRNWKLLIDSMTSLPIVVRSQLLDDAFAASRADLLSYNVTMDLVWKLENETDYLVWDTAMRGLRYIQSRLYSDPTFKKLMLKLVQTIFNKVGSTEQLSDGHRERRWRGEILKWACENDHEECLDRAHEYLKNLISMPAEQNKIPANLRSWVYCTGLKRAGKEGWNFLWDKYLKTSPGAEKELLLEALGCIPDKDILLSYLRKSMRSDSGIRQQDGWRVFRSVADNSPQGQNISLDFIKENWSDINEYYGTGFSVVTKMVLGLSKYMNTESDLLKLKDFRNSVSVGKVSTAFEQVIEEVRINVNWMKNYSKQMQDILRYKSIY